MSHIAPSGSRATVPTVAFIPAVAPQQTPTHAHAHTFGSTRRGRSARCAALDLEIGETVLGEVLATTRLAGKPLLKVYTASVDGFSCNAFHDAVDLTGVPTLLLGKTMPQGPDEPPVLFGAFNPMGWQSLDDYQNSVTPFLFRVPANDSETTERLISRKVGGPGAALFDFADWAVRFGPDSLSIPMNERKGVKRTVATSKLGTYYELLADGSSSVLGPRSQVELQELEAFVAEGYNEPPPPPKSMAAITSDVINDIKDMSFGIFGKKK